MRLLLDTEGLTLVSREESIALYDVGILKV